MDEPADGGGGGGGGAGRFLRGGFLGPGRVAGGDAPSIWDSCCDDPSEGELLVVAVGGDILLEEAMWLVEARGKVLDGVV